MELERDIADFIGLQNSIIYAQGFSTTSSVIPSFSKRGDIIVVDRGVNFSIQKGIQISRSTIRWFDHNDMGSLEKVLEQLRIEEIKYRRKLTRKFIITEALFEADGQICDLPTIVRPHSFSNIWVKCRIEV
jgi:serine palmitoyltransferase